jgi:poly-gamma-glutamate capsule biosynthesis protein CapA/YwtB (metallophosphatase superfamily)
MKRPAILLFCMLPIALGFAVQSENQPATFALTGDSIITQKLSVYGEPEFLRMIDTIRSADVAFTNLEMLFHDYEPYPAPESGGTYMRADPALLKDVLWAGFDVVSLANNHAVDYGIEGLKINREWVKKSGLAFAGVGDNLTLARTPGYVDSGIGRVALISCASTFPSFGFAGPARPDVHGRPGLNPLRFSTIYRLDAEGMEALRVVQSKLSGGRGGGRGGSNSINFQGNRFELAEKPGRVTVPNEQDMEELIASIRAAKKQAVWVIVAVHSHESGGGNRERPAEFFETFAHAAVDSGADMIVGTGSHVLEGVEIYKGRPIFYGLGDFIFQNETVAFLPAENYLPYRLGPEATPADFSDRRYSNDTRGFPVDEKIWQSVVALPRFRGDQLERIELLPISLGQKKPRPLRGRPLPAAGEEAQRIIERMAELSAAYGTKIAFQNGRGVIIP